MVLLPVKKETRKGKDENGDMIDAIIRHDSAIFLNILSQVDWNKGEYKKISRSCTKLMKAFRKWNFDHEDQTGEVSSEIQITEEQLDHLEDIAIKSTPDTIKKQGVMMMETLVDFEEWLDVRKAKKSTESESAKPADAGENPAGTGETAQGQAA